MFLLTSDLKFALKSFDGIGKPRSGPYMNENLGSSFPYFLEVSKLVPFCGHPASLQTKDLPERGWPLYGHGGLLI